MNNSYQKADPIHYASSALASGRRIRALASHALATNLDEEASHHLFRIASTLAGSEAFAERSVDCLREAIAVLELRVATGTTADFETYDAWDDRGVETTAVRSVRQTTDQAQLLATIVAELRLVAGQIEATLDLIAAEAIVTALRRRD